MDGGTIIIAAIALVALLLWGERLVDRAAAAIASAVDFVGFPEDEVDPVDALRRGGGL